jgi:hypothetical protein
MNMQVCPHACGGWRGVTSSYQMHGVCGMIPERPPIAKNHRKNAFTHASRSLSVYILRVSLFFNVM